MFSKYPDTLNHADDIKFLSGLAFKENIHIIFFIIELELILIFQFTVKRRVEHPLAFILRGLDVMLLVHTYIQEEDEKLVQQFYLAEQKFVGLFAPILFSTLWSIFN